MFTNLQQYYIVLNIMKKKFYALAYVENFLTLYIAEMLALNQFIKTRNLYEEFSLNINMYIF